MANFGTIKWGQDKFSQTPTSSEEYISGKRVGFVSHRLHSISPDVLGGLWAVRDEGTGNFNRIVYYRRVHATITIPGSAVQSNVRTFQINGQYQGVQFVSDKTFSTATDLSKDMSDPIKVLVDERLAGLWVFVRSARDRRYCYLRFLLMNSGKAFDILDPEINAPFRFIVSRNLTLDYSGSGVWFTNFDNLVHADIKTQTVDKRIETGIIKKLGRGQTLWYIEKSPEGHSWVNRLSREEII